MGARASARLLPAVTALLFAWSRLSALPEGDAAAARSKEPAVSALEADRADGSQIIAYQVGAFLERKNADRLVEKLGAKDIVGDIGKKTVGGRTFWTVTVAVSGIPFENLQQELLDAGYASFPIFRPSPPASRSLSEPTASFR
jgi:hypothetical protein